MKFNRVIALMLAFLMGTIGTIEAKSYSSSRSYKSSPSKSYSSSPKSTKPSSSKYSSSSKKATKPAPMKFKSPKEKASYEKAKKSGTAFSSKSSAQKDFKTIVLSINQRILPSLLFDPTTFQHLPKVPMETLIM
jgi:hypothetical protein